MAGILDQPRVVDAWRAISLSLMYLAHAPRHAEDRPARLPHPAHPRRRAGVRGNGGRARAMDHRAALGPDAPRARGTAEAACQTQGERDGGAVMIEARHFLWRTEGPVGVVTLNRPER